MKSIPDDFPLTDRAEGTEGMLMRFREGTSESHVEIIPDDYLQMSLAQGQALADVSKFKQGIQSLKKFFKLEENSFRPQPVKGGNRWPLEIL